MTQVPTELMWQENQLQETIIIIIVNGSRDVSEAVGVPAKIDGFHSAPHKRVQLVLRAKRREMINTSAATAKEITRRKWRQSKGEAHFRGRRKCVIVAVGHNAQNGQEKKKNMEKTPKLILEKPGWRRKNPSGKKETTRRKKAWDPRTQHIATKR